MFGLFENFSTTSEGKKHSILPLSIKVSPSMAFDKIVKYIESNKLYTGLKSNKDFYDIYFVDCGFEITIIIGQEGNGTSSITIQVYGEKKRGRTRKRLRLMREELEEALQQFKA